MIFLRVFQFLSAALLTLFVGWHVRTQMEHSRTTPFSRISLTLDVLFAALLALAIATMWGALIR